MDATPDIEQKARISQPQGVRVVRIVKDNSKDGYGS